MISDQVAVTAAYLEHLSDNDVALVSDPCTRALPVRALRASLRERRGGIEDLLGSPDVYQGVFGRGRDDDPLLHVSPFLVFAVAVQRAVKDLEAATYVPEWSGIGRRTPVFDVGRLRDFVADPWCRLFLAELLASFTHVASGSIVVTTRRGLRRRRFSELDPVLLAGMLDVVAEAERPGVLRRLGDLALFLTGVFPDHLARQGFGPVQEGRLLRAGGLTPVRGNDDDLGPGALSATGDVSAVSLLEELGRRWYQAALQTAPRPLPANVGVLAKLPRHFSDARRVIGLLTERIVFPYRDRWFGLGSSH
jgi:hypothetical protein